MPHGRTRALIEARLSFVGKQNIEIGRLNDVEDGVEIGRLVILVDESSLQLHACGQSSDVGYVETISSTADI